MIKLGIGDGLASAKNILNKVNDDNPNYPTLG